MVKTQAVGEAMFGPLGQHLVVDELYPYYQRKNYAEDAISFYLGLDLSALTEVTLLEKTSVLPIASGMRVWMRSYSPNGAEMAVGMLSRGVMLSGTYDFATGRLKTLKYAIGTYDDNWSCAFGCPLWISNHRFIDEEISTVGKREEILGRLAYDNEVVEEADRDTWTGERAAMTVYGAASGEFVRGSVATLVLVNADSGRMSVLDRGRWAEFSLSPDRRLFAALREARALDLGSVKVLAYPRMDENLQLVVYRFRNGQFTGSVVPCDGCNVTPGSMRWSPSGDKLFFDTRVIEAGMERHEQYIFDWRDKLLKRFDLRGEALRGWGGRLDGPYDVPFVWLNDRTPAIELKHTVPGPDRVGTVRGETRYDWFAIHPGGAAISLTARVPRNTDGPMTLVAAHGGSLFVMSDGELWRVGAHESPVNLTYGVTQTLSPFCSVVSLWRPYGLEPVCSAFQSDYEIREVDAEALAKGWLTFRMLETGVATAKLLFLNIDTGRKIELLAPSPRARLITASALAEAALYHLESQSGDQLILVRKGRPNSVLWRFNTGLSRISGARTVMLTRRGFGGDKTLFDWLLLPPSYHPGDREPLLVYFYPDKQYGEGWDPATLMRSVSFLNPEIAASQGYAVLLASMKKLPVGRQLSNPCSEMHRQLIEAAQNAVEKGYADPARWALMGHSYGGYGVYCTIAHTRAFKAAIALDGLSNLTSNYGTGGFPDVAGNSANLSYGSFWSEGGQGRMGEPPWVDPLRYIQNSPIFYANRIVTPLLIFHGNSDTNVSVEQSEEMFNALHRLGQHVEFVRFWGEGHVVRSPANMREMWRLITAWLDRYLDIQRDSGGQIIPSRYPGSTPVSTPR